MQEASRIRRASVSPGSDGMTLDAKGNLYLTGKGVYVFNPAGEKIGHIPIPEAWTANVCFGGPKQEHALYHREQGALPGPD